MPVPGENIRSWSTNATTNGAADSSIGWAEGQTRASVNNSARGMMAAHAKWRDLINGSIVTTGSANAQAFSSGLSYSVTPEAGLIAKLKIGATFTNTAAMTLNMDSLGAVAVLGNDGAALVGGEVVAGAYADFLWNGTNWILLNVKPSRSAFSVTKGGTDQTGVSNGAYTQITFSTEVYDLGSDFSANTWTPPPGKVAMSASFRGTGTITATAACAVGIYKNGAIFRSVILPSQTSQCSAMIAVHDVATGSDVYYAVALMTLDSGSGTILGAANDTWFMGAVID